MQLILINWGNPKLQFFSFLWPSLIGTPDKIINQALCSLPFLTYANGKAKTMGLVNDSC